MKRIHTIVLTLLLLISITGCSRENNSDTTDAYQDQPTATITTKPEMPEQPDVTKDVPDQSTEAPTTESGLYPAYIEVEGTRKYGYINAEGSFVLPTVYDYASNFDNGAAVVMSKDQYQVINNLGEVIFEREHKIEDYHNGAAVYQETIDNTPLMGYIDPAGKVLLEANYTYASAFNEDNEAIVRSDNDTYSVIDNTGNVLENFTLPKNYYTLDEIKNGYRVFTDEETWNQGIVNLQNEIIFEPIYSEITNLGKGLFAIRKSGPDKFASLLEPMAVFNKNGEQLSDYIHYEINEYTGTLASASDEHYTYFIDEMGKPMEALPKVEGIGTLRLLGDVIQADVDQELFYLRKDGSVIWRPDQSKKLTDSIVVKQLKYRPNRFTLIFYPELNGLKDLEAQASINDKLKSLFLRTPDEFIEDDKTYINDNFSAILNKDLLIINKTGYDYPYQAAHGMPIDDYYYFNVKTGEQYTLADLFKENSYFVSTLNMILDEQIKESGKNPDNMFFADSFNGISVNQYFRLSKDALNLYFYPSEIAAYAAGFPDFDIPYSDVIDLIDTEGSFWNSFDHNEEIPSTRNTDTELLEVMDTLIMLYERALINAINYNILYYLEPHLVEGSKLSNEQKELSAKLFNKGIKEEYVSSKVEKVEYDEAKDNYLVYVTEVIAIDYPDKASVTNEYHYIYTVNKSKEQQRYQLSDIVKWEP